MSRIIVKYNNKKITSFTCPTDKLDEGLAFLSKRYSNCVLTIC